MSEQQATIEGAMEEGLRLRERGLAHMPDIMSGTAPVRCGTCRFHSGQGEPGMGYCRRYRGSLTMYTRSWEVCWHHQIAARAPAKEMADAE